MATTADGSGEPTANRDQVLLDQNVLAELRADLGDVEFVNEILASFLEQLDLRLTALNSAAGAVVDREGLRFAAHSLKSASAQLGVSALAEQSAVIETSAPQSSDDQLRREVEELNRIARASRIAVESELAGYSQ